MTTAAAGLGQAKWYDIGAGRLAGSADLEAFVLSIVYSPTDPSQLLAGPRGIRPPAA